MISTRWLDQRQPHWKRLEALLEQTTRQGFKSLTRSELQELGLLYRQLATDLSTLREQPGSMHFVAHLNQLLARAHHTIYSTERQSAIAAVRSFVASYPRVLRENLRPCLVSLALLVGGGLLGTLAAWRDPAFKASILGPAMVETIDRHEMWTHSIVAIKPTASSQIMTNNMSVSLVAFGAGITVVGTLYILVFNGVMLGVVGMACGQAGMSLALWSFVAPHGVLELPAIVIAGGAGLRLSQGLLFPGVLPRRQSVAIAGGKAIRLVLGCIPVLVVAGIIEAFVSPTGLAIPMKFAFAAALFAVFAAYLTSSNDQMTK